MLHPDNEVPEYEAPQVVDYGNLIDLTAGSAHGCWTDADFPLATKKDELTFSGDC